MQADVGRSAPGGNLNAALSALLLAAEASSANSWQCTLGYPDQPTAYQWQINLADDTGPLTVTDERSRTVQTSLITADTSQLVFALNSVRWDARRLVKGKPRQTAYITGSIVRLDRQTGQITVDNQVTDADGVRLDLAAIEARAAEEAAAANASGRPPANSPIFWLMMRVAATPQTGICTPHS